MAELCFPEFGGIADLVDKRVFNVALSRMDSDSLGFVYDEKAFCLGYYLKHLLLGLSLGGGFRCAVEKFIRKPYLYDITFFYGNVLIDLFAVYPDVTALERMKQIRGFKLRVCLLAGLYDMKSVLGSCYLEITHLLPLPVCIS